MLVFRHVLLLATASLLPAAARAASFTYTTLMVHGQAQGGGIAVSAVWNDEAIGTVVLKTGQAGYIWSNGKTTTIPAFVSFGPVNDSGLAVAYPPGDGASYATYDLTTGATKNFTVSYTGSLQEFAVTSINAAGTVAGLIDTSGAVYQSQPFTQDASGNLTFLTAPSAAVLYYTGISNAGTVVLTYLHTVSLYDSGTIKPFTIKHNRVVYADLMTETGTFGGYAQVAAGSPNGTGFTSTGKGSSAFAFPGARFTSVTGVNMSGEIVGIYALPGDGTSHGFIYSKHHYTSIDYPGASETSIKGISETGALIGSYQTTATGTDNFPFIAVCPGGGVCTP